MNLNEEFELEYDKKNQVKKVVKECIEELIDRFWVLKETDEKLFFQIKDNENELKKFFRDTFRYRLISTHEIIKLEKIPVTPMAVWGEKSLKGTKIFQKPKDFAFFFRVLAFLESKSQDQQFSLKEICEAISSFSETKIEWKEGVGYQNRLSLIRVLKYCVKMRLIIVQDKELEDFSGNDNHDVLFDRTPYSSYFLRVFTQEDVQSWDNLMNFLTHLKKENEEFADRKHRYYRKLFLMPMIYHKEMSEEDNDYIKNYYTGVENTIYRYTNYTYERYSRTSLLVRNKYGITDKVFPSDSMNSKLVMLFGNYIFSRPLVFPINERGEVEILKDEMPSIVSDLRNEYKQNWTKKMKQAKVDIVQEELVSELKTWEFLEEKPNGFYVVKEGLFRIMGDYFEE